VLGADGGALQDKGIEVCCAFAKKAPAALVKQVAGALSVCSSPTCECCSGGVCADAAVSGYDTWCVASRQRL